MTTIPITDTLNATVGVDDEGVYVEFGETQLTDRTTLKLATAVLTEAIDHITMNDELHGMVVEARSNLDALLRTMRRDEE